MSSSFQIFKTNNSILRDMHTMLSLNYFSFLKKMVRKLEIML